MSEVFHALLPVFVLIALGLVLKETAFLGAAFWSGLEKLNYWVLMPVLFFQTLAGATLGDLPYLRIGAATALALSAMALVLWALRRPCGWDGPVFTSVLQGGIRFNSFVGLAVMLQLFGPPGLVLGTIIVAATVPLVNVLCVLALVHYGRGQHERPSLARSLLTNPLIVGCAAGAAWNALGLPLPVGIANTLKALAQASLVTGILAVGAALEWSGLHAQRGVLLAAVAFKLVLMPLWVAVVCASFGLTGAIAAGMIFFEALPTATSSYILARQMGGDYRLMSAIVTAQTVGAFISLPVVLALVR